MYVGVWSYTKYIKHIYVHAYLPASMFFSLEFANVIFSGIC